MISDMLVHEKKPPFVNQHRVAYKFQCDLCHASHVRYTLRHMHQRAAEHTKQSSSTGKHFTNEHCIVQRTLTGIFPSSRNVWIRSIV